MSLLIIALLAAFAYTVGHLTRRLLSEVIVFIAIGIIVGPQVLNVIDSEGVESLDPVVALALAALVFLLGERLEFSRLREISHTLLPIAILENLATFGIVFATMLAVGLSLEAAYLLAAIALSTSPTTLLAVIAERRARGRFTEHLLAATAINNLVSGAVFGLGLPLVVLSSGDPTLSEGAVTFIQLVVASLVIGGTGGWVLRRWYTATHGVGDRLLFLMVVLLGVVAASQVVETPSVLSALVMGAVAANDPRDLRPLFASLRTLEAPIYLIFFVVAGAGVHLDELVAIGGFASAFVAARIIGKFGGAWAGTLMTRSGRRSGWGIHFGNGLLPFAGMAIGLGAFAFEKISQAGASDLGGDVNAIVLGSVVILELLGPFTVGFALDATGDTGRARTSDVDPEIPVRPEAAPHLVHHILFPISTPEMAHSKAPPVVNFALSANATLTALHIVPLGARDPDLVDPVLSIVSQLASARGLRIETVVREAESVREAIVEVAREAAVDLIMMGEPAPRLLDAGGHRLAHEVAEHAEVPVLIVPTVRENIRRVPRDQVPRSPTVIPPTPDLDADQTAAERR